MQDTLHISKSTTTLVFKTNVGIQEKPTLKCSTILMN